MSDYERQYSLKTANIIQETRHRTTYFPILKSITMDGQISITRMLVSFGVLVGVGGPILMYLFGDGKRIPYILLPSIGLVISLIIVLINYVISSRDYSMLYSSYYMIMSWWSDVKTQSRTLKRFGIKKIHPDGYIEFRNGDFGEMYFIEGQMSRSMLPAIAERSASIRSQYLVSRSATSQEILITSIKNIDAENQLNSLAETYESISGESKSDAWRRYMIKMQHTFIQSNVMNAESKISQILILREVSKEHLQKSTIQFQNSVSNGMLKLAVQIKDPKKIIKSLAPLMLTSKKGIINLEKEAEKKKIFDRQ